MIRAITNAVNAKKTSMGLGSELTRGGLVAATLEAKVNGAPVKVACHFNPTELTITKTNSYEGKAIMGSNIPDVKFVQGNSETITLTLWFDSTTSDNDNIRKITDKLWKFVRIDPSKKDAKSKKGRPPEVTFKWEQFTFTGVVTSMTHSYVLFNEKGAPLRAKVTIALQQTVDADLPNIQSSTKSLMSKIDTGLAMIASLQSLSALGAIAVSAAPAIASSAVNKGKGIAVSAGVISQEGTRIDHVAAATTGDSSNQRQVAENNNIDNPMKMPKGRIIN